MSEASAVSSLALIVARHEGHLEDLSADNVRLSEKVCELRRQFDCVLAACVDVQRLLQSPLTDEQIGLLALESRAGILAAAVPDDDILRAPGIG